jgi:hypothetical protein
MIWRKGAPDDRAGRQEVNGELTGDSRVLEVGDPRQRSRELLLAEESPQQSPHRGF